MRIEIDDDFILKGDELQFMLARRYVAASGKRAGEEIEQPVGYYRKMHEALTAYTEVRAGSSDATTIQGYINELKAAQKHVESLFEEEK